MKRTLRMRILSLLLVLTTLMGMSTNVSAFIIAVTTVEEKENTILETTGSDWTVRAELDRRDTWPEDVAIRAEEVGGDEYIVSTGIVDFTFARFFDIALMAGGEEIQPEGRTVRVEIAVPELEEDVDEIQVVHFATDRSSSQDEELAMAVEELATSEEEPIKSEAELAAPEADNSKLEVLDRKSLLKHGNRLMAAAEEQLPVEENNTHTGKCCVHRNREGRSESPFV